MYIVQPDQPNTSQCSKQKASQPACLTTHDVNAQRIYKREKEKEEKKPSSSPCLLCFASLCCAALLLMLIFRHKENKIDEATR